MIEEFVQNDILPAISGGDPVLIEPEETVTIVQYEQSVSSGDELLLLLQEQQKTNSLLSALVFITLFAWAHGHLKNAVREVFKSGKSA